MSYNYRIPELNLYAAYNAFVDGKPKEGRHIIRQYYREGLKNPRACLYEASKEVRNLENWAADWDKVAKTKMSKNDFNARQQAHRNTINEMLNPTNKLVKQIRDELIAEFRQKYKGETRSMSEFIINRTVIPEFKYLRRLAKVLFK